MIEHLNERNESDNVFFERYLKYKDFLERDSTVSFLRIKVKFFFIAILKWLDILSLCFGTANKNYSTNVDVLVAMNEKIDIKRLQYIITDIERRGYTVKVEWVGGRKKSLLKWIFYPVVPYIPNGLRLEFKYVAWLLNVYNPKVVIIMQNTGLFPGILRRKLNERGGSIINLVHGVGYLGINHSSTDTDYLFVFGQSTIEGKRNNSNRIGHTYAVKVGSPFVYGQMTSELRNTVVTDNKHILIASQWLPNDYSLKNDTYQSRQIITDLIAQTKEKNFVVKLHPLEDDGYWQELSKKIVNLKMLPKAVTLLQALESSSICLHMSSNASIEAGVLRVPSIAVDVAGRSFFLSHEKYMPVVQTTEELIQALKLISNNYKAYQTKALEYACFHLECFSGAGIRIVDNIEILLKGYTIPNGIIIKDPLTF